MILTCTDGSTSFPVTVLGNDNSSHIALFAVGAGGLPARYSTLLEVLNEAGIKVIAPHFEPLTSPYPSQDELLLRAKRLLLAMDTFSHATANICGVGHSIGATILLAMSGAQMWLGPGQPLDIPAEARLKNLALLAPATGFFQAPGALDRLSLPITVRVGSEDTVTPVAQAQFLAQAAPQTLPIQLIVDQGAGHFSYMDNGPPRIPEPLQDKAAFLIRYSREVSHFLTHSAN